MALCGRYTVNLARKFSVCSQVWSESNIDVYRQNAVWNEGERVRYHVRLAKEAKDDEYYGEFREKVILTFHKWGRRLMYKGLLREYIEERMIAEEKLKQQFLQDRVDTLGPDLAAAHFIISKGGSVKFSKMKEWIGKNDHHINIPCQYVSGYFIEGINAAGTGLYYEGLECFYQLNKLKWLSLKGLTNLNDFALDLISGRYGHQLEYLDLTGCTGMTHYGLASFYRFKCLKLLNVTGLDHTPEFKLSCLMIQDLLPDLKFKGIDFTVSEPEDESSQEVQTLNPCPTGSVTKIGKPLQE